MEKMKKNLSNETWTFLLLMHASHLESWDPQGGEN